MKEIVLATLTGFAVALTVMIFFLVACYITGSDISIEPLSVIAPMLSCIIGAVSGFITHLRLSD